jgi:CelD/BcsL family acetyltransferase involved in cellulose biosynthesis
MEPRMTAAPATARAVAPSSTTKTSTTLTVETSRDPALSRADILALDALIDARPEVGVFLSTAWLSGYFEEPPAGAEPMLVLIREGVALRGLTAIAVRRLFTHVEISLLGGGAGSDRVDLLAADGFETACADRFIRWLGEADDTKGFALQLRDVPSDSPLWGAFRRAAAEGIVRAALAPRDVHTLPYLDLGTPGLSAGSPPCPSLDKHRRWLDRRGSLSIETLDDPREVLAAFDALRGFLHDRWRGRGQASTLDDERQIRFHRRALPLLLADGRLRMLRMSSDLRTIAVFYGLASGRWWGYYLAGYDREWAGRIHLGRLTLAAAIQMAVKDRAAEFDFLKGTEPVKYLWPVRERTTLDGDLYSPGFGAQIARAGRAAAEAGTALVRSACGLSARRGHGTHPTVR